VKIKSLFIQAENNKMSQDVEGLYLVVSYVSSQVIVMRWFGCSSWTSRLSSRVVLETFVVIWGKRFTRRAKKASRD